MSDAVAKPYATALLELAAEAGKVDQYGKDLSIFAEAFENSSELRVVLTNPGLALETRHEVLTAVLAKTRTLKLVKNFLHLLIDRGRINFVGQILRTYQESADEAAGRVRGIAVSTVALTKPQLTKLSTAMTSIVGREVILEARIDEHLIGGLRVEVGGQVFDGSVRGQLDRIRDHLAV